MTDELPLTEAEFYTRRDDRTDAVLAEVSDDQYYQNASLLVVADPDRAATVAGQGCLLTLTNVLSRFARDVDVVVPDVELATQFQGAHTHLPARLLADMGAANPFGNFERGRTRSSTDYDAALTLGTVDVGVRPVVRVDATGWLARITRDQDVPMFSRRDPNPIGPGVGACLAVAELFKTLVDISARLNASGYTFDAYDLEVHPLTAQESRPSLSEPVRLGDVHLVGVGSVGSALLYFLRWLPVQGQFHLVDCDHVEYVNLNRSPIFTASDAVDTRAKVTVGQEYLADHVSVTGHDMRYGQFVETVQDDPADVVIPVANEYGVRSTIQHNRPPVMVHTTTGGSRVYVRRHIPLVDPCLLCHFPPDEVGFTSECANAPASAIGSSAPDATAEPDEHADAALPFVSVMAGALLAGELIKLNRDDYPVTPDFVELDMFSTFENSPLAYDWPCAPECPFCVRQNEAFYRRKIEGTRFANLSNPDQDDVS